MKILFARFAVLLIFLSSAASAHDSVWKAFANDRNNEDAGRPYVDPDTGYTFVDADGRRTLKWQAGDKAIKAVRVTDIDLTSNTSIGNWNGLGRVETREVWQALVGGSFVFDYDDDLLYDTNASGFVEVLIDTAETDELGLMYDHIASGPITELFTPDPEKGRYQWLTLPFDHARFANRLYGGGDFGIFARGSVYPPDPKFKRELVILEIKVTIESHKPVLASASGRLALTVIDSDTKAATPVRFGLYHRETGWSPLPGEQAIEFNRSAVPIRQINLRTAFDEGKVWPGKGSWISYTDGNYQADLPAGEYQLVISKGPEYRLVDKIIRVEAGKTNNFSIQMQRWYNSVNQSWYPADLHLHIDRFTQSDSVHFGQLLQAEGLSLGANLQIMYDDIFVYRQIFGAAGRHQQGDDLRHGGSLTIPGQETPRGSQWGHFSGLDVSEFHRPDNYLAPHEILPVLRKDDALVGMHHVMLDLFGASAGLSMNQPLGQGFDYMEIMQYSTLNPKLMYDILNLGYKITPSAGSDYPAMGFIGQERTYAKVPGEFSRDKWKNAIRAGNVYVSNGPILTFSVNGAEMGHEIQIKPGQLLNVAASAQINPDFGEIKKIELIEQGDVIDSVSSESGQESLKLEVQIKPTHGTWLAIRVYGKDSAKAHSGIIYVTVEGQKGFWKYTAADEIVQAAKERIDAAMAKPDLDDPRQWATAGRLHAYWKSALPSNQARAKAAKAALEQRLKEIKDNWPEGLSDKEETTAIGDKREQRELIP
jgi:hypothetical protein